MLAKKDGKEQKKYYPNSYRFDLNSDKKKDIFLSAFYRKLPWERAKKCPTLPKADHRTYFQKRTFSCTGQGINLCQVK